MGVLLETSVVGFEYTRHDHRERSGRKLHDKHLISCSEIKEASFNGTKPIKLPIVEYE